METRISLAPTKKLFYTEVESNQLLSLKVLGFCILKKMSYLCKRKTSSLKKLLK